MEFNDRQKKIIMERLERYNYYTVAGAFDKHLNSEWAAIDICGLDYPASEVLYRVDECEYDHLFSKWEAEHYVCFRIDCYYKKEDILRITDILNKEAHPTFGGGKNV